MQYSVILSSDQRPGRKSLCDEKDGGAGHARHRSADVKRIAAEVRPASGAQA